MAGQLWRRDVRPGGLQRERIPARIKQPVGGVGGVQIVVEHAMRRGLALLAGFLDLGQVCGIGAQQVVQGVSVRCGLRDEVRPGQLGEQSARRGERHPGETGGGPHGQDRAGMQAQ